MKEIDEEIIFYAQKFLLFSIQAEREKQQ